MSTSAKHASPLALCIAESSMRHCHTLLLSMIKSVKCTMSSTDRGHLYLGPDLIDKKRRPADDPIVRFINGPGNNAASIRNGESYQLKAGDVVVIPAGTGHWFTKIDDHIDYLMIRIDPDKVTPLRDEQGIATTICKNDTVNGDERLSGRLGGVNSGRLGVSRK